MFLKLVLILTFHHYLRNCYKLVNINDNLRPFYLLSILYKYIQTIYNKYIF